MTPFRQLLEHRPDAGQYGDCLRTAIGSLLDLPPDQVPHFAHDNPGGAEVWQRVDAFVARHGYRSVGFPVFGSPREVMDMMANQNPDVFYILGGKSAVGRHVVVCCGGEMVCDPGGSDGLVGPDDDGRCWIVLFVPLSQVRGAILMPVYVDKPITRTMLHAAELLEEEALALKQSSTVDGDWGEDLDAKAAHDDMAATAQALRCFCLSTRAPDDREAVAANEQLHGGAR